MAGKRKVHTAAFKAQVARAALKADLTVNELAGHYSVHRTLIPAWKQQLLWSGMLKKSGLLTLHRGGETFADLGGLVALEAFCARALRPGRRAEVRARGVLLLGPPGSGKSAFCKALGAGTGRPTLIHTAERPLGRPGR